MQSYKTYLIFTPIQAKKSKALIGLEINAQCHGSTASTTIANHKKVGTQFACVGFEYYLCTLKQKN